MFAYFRTPLTWRELARRTLADTREDDCPGLAAQLAFYFFLSVFPALLFVVSLLAYVPVETRLAGAIAQLEAFLPQEILQFLREQIDEALAGRQGELLTVGIVGAIWSSSSAVTAIITALNRAYDIDEWRPWWKRRLIAIALTIALAVFVVVAFVFVVGGGDLAAWVADRLGFGEWLARVWTIVQWMLTIALVVVAVDLVYYVAPNADTPIVWVTPGALLATGLWLLTSLGFKVYVQNFSSYTAVHGHDRGGHRSAAVVLSVPGSRCSWARNSTQRSIRGCTPSTRSDPDSERSWACRGPRSSTASVNRTLLEFTTAEGVVAVLDFMPVRSGLPDVVRIVVGRRGRVSMRMDLVIRFDYGSVVPRVRRVPGAAGTAERGLHRRGAGVARVARALSRGASRPDPHHVRHPRRASTHGNRTTVAPRL